MQARGPVKWIVQSLKVFGIDLKEMAVGAIAERVEKKVGTGEERKKRPGLGLFQCAMESGKFALSEVKKFTEGADQPFLIFLHGTASSTWGSFGDLWSPERTYELAQLRAYYGERVLAYEHASLTQSPIENAFDLIARLEKVLPGDAMLHVVTHSRGGMIGELLCRAAATKKVHAGDEEKEAPTIREPFAPEEYLAFEASKKRDDGRQLEALHALNEALADTTLRVDRLVRVACPALGTTLASGRLDRWLSVLGTLAGSSLPGSPLSDAFKDIGDFFAGVIQQRTEPDALPGLAAMLPDAPLVRLLNSPVAEVEGTLSVIAGDIDPKAWWARLLVWVTDRFYEGDHDLVVNTSSMLGGARRRGSASVSFHQGAGVNHFQYFANEDSAQSLVSALLSPEKLPVGFEPLRPPRVHIARAPAVSVEPRPIVLVLPGIMGSELDAGGERVWIHLFSLLRGEIKDLRIDAEGVTAVGVIARYYGELMDYLGQTHNVIDFPYDWRLPVEKEADRLAGRVQAALAQAQAQNQPVRILAHSMGGLVARTMIARHPGLWTSVCEHEGARLVMLGTPNGGSHAITELLVGQATTLRQLARLDLRHDRKDLLDIIGRFPGVLAMLPKDHREDFFSPEVWGTYHDKAGEGWIRPKPDDLAQAQAFRELLDQAPIQPERMVYVAGRADVTVEEMYLDTTGKEPRIRFRATARGDGRVTWDSGIPSGVPTWYMDVTHGDLACSEAHFPAIEDLLTTGRTGRLPTTAPVSRALAPTFERPDPLDELYPNEDVLVAGLMGASTSYARPRRPSEPPFDARVVHGDLRFANHAVCVGHYAGDTIISAEAVLDEELEGALALQQRLGLYPGKRDTHAIFINPKLASDRHARPKGAVVIGLGTVGELSPAALTKGITRALVDFALRWHSEPCSQPQQLDGRRPDKSATELGVSSLLIGTGAGGMPVSDALFALIKAIRDANRALDEAGHPCRIAVLEIIELWEDNAIKAAKALVDLNEGPHELHQVCRFDGVVRPGKDGLRRAMFTESPGWWDRLHILGDIKDPDGATGTLRFSASTRRARTEVRLLPTQRKLVDQYIERSIRSTRDDRESAKTLFELILPNELKEQAPDQGDLVLIVDEAAAVYPWELLENRWGRTSRPLVIEHGLLRQLESVEFRETVRGVSRDTALVIGDPISSWPELKGAQEEARAVHEALNAVPGFRSTAHIRPTTKTVVDALYADEYKVLHLAGHGAYEHPAVEALQCDACGQSLTGRALEKQQQALGLLTGMIVGDDVVFSPKEVEQMRQVPELVFINCCHLGYIQEQPFNKLAANVATAFIRMGVRAVIAAGWAVDDRAAVTFATAFYAEMLRGERFGKAVLAARKATFDRHPGTNTWGAYQCYGDPDYQLFRKAETAGRDKRARRYVSPREAAVEIGNMRSSLSKQARIDSAGASKALDEIVEELKSRKVGGLAWLDHGSLSSALGAAYGEIGDFRRALHYYEHALGCEDAEIRIKDYEQLINLQVRYAASLQRAADVKEAKAQVDGAIARLQSLITSVLPEGQAATIERRSIEGSAYKRRAWISEESRAGDLERMRDAYLSAYQRREALGYGDFAYPLLNVLAADLAIAWQAGKAGLSGAAKTRFNQQLEIVKAEVERSYSEDPSFWNTIMLAEIKLYSALKDGKLSDTERDKIAARYLEARKRSSPREFESALDQIDFMTEMAKPMPAINQSLTQLRGRLN
jgi:tetratricopeptide (TPR) repeat protein